MLAFLKSFVYAFKGITYCIINERNMRVHFTCLSYMVFFLLRFDFFQVTRTQAAILALAAALVIVSEYINTAVERTVDTAANGEFSDNARIAKDTAAGAVLIAALFSVVVGIIILYQPSAFKAMFAYFISNPLSLMLFAISLVLAIIFMFVSPKKYLKFLRRK